MTDNAAVTGGPAALERPIALEQAPAAWGSDAIAEMLRALDLPFVCLNPGASYRGLHDSLVNHLGNRQPQMLLCLHEESAVAIAHGYAKVTGRPLGVILHSNVGLMHGSMGIFNAWCDRVPMMVLGATGPVDAASRRPWIDWIHTARDQGALVRHFIKWDDLPASVPAAQEALLRAHMIACTAPHGPVYVCLDAAMQEAALPAPPPVPDVARFRPPPALAPAGEPFDRAVALLAGAQRPAILMGRVSRGEAAWVARVALAERLGATVLTDLKVAGAFPTDHPLHGAAPGMFPGAAMIEALRASDLVLSLDWVDLAGTLRAAWPTGSVGATVISVSVDQHCHNGWSMDHQGLPPVDLTLLAEPDAAVPALLAALPARSPTPRAAVAPAAPAPAPAAGDISVPALAAALRQQLGDAPSCLIRAPLSWSGDLWTIRHPLDYLGYDGGGGIGSGPGMAVGAALALAGGERLPVAVLGDGDFLMGCTALWTAVHFRVPLLVVVANNRSFFNDEIHQDRVARQRTRPVENRWIGQRISDPDIDLAAMARAQGALGIGPVADAADLPKALAEAVAAVRGGACCVVDVRVLAAYDGATAAAMVRKQ